MVIRKSFPLRERRRGAAAVEFAVCGIALVTLILGIFELSRLLMVQHQLTNAARVGCRTGIVPGKSNSDITTAVNNFLTTQSINTDTVTVQVNDNTGNVSNANSGDEVTVKVSVAVSTVSWVPVLRYFNGTLTGQYTLSRE
jgi:Flp pilus assembly protein TadG